MSCFESNFWKAFWVMSWSESKFWKAIWVMSRFESNSRKLFWVVSWFESIFESHCKSWAESESKLPETELNRIKKRVVPMSNVYSPVLVRAFLNPPDPCTFPVWRKSASYDLAHITRLPRLCVRYVTLLRWLNPDCVPSIPVWWVVFRT